MQALLIFYAGLVVASRQFDTRWRLALSVALLVFAVIPGSLGNFRVSCIVNYDWKELC